MTAEMLEKLLLEILESQEDLTYADLETFAEAGVMTNNAGLVLRMPGGSEFQITIVKSK